MATNYKKTKKEVGSIAEVLIKLLLLVGCNPLTIARLFSKKFNEAQVRKVISSHIGIDEKSLLRFQNVAFLRAIREQNPKVNL